MDLKTIPAHKIVIAATFLATCSAQQNEIGLTMGRMLATDRGGPAGSLHFGSGTALQANYGYRFLNNRKVALLAEVHFLANAQRKIRSDLATVTRDVATVFVTPGLRAKFAPHSRVSPYVAAGAGLVWFQQSLTTLSGAPNPADRNSYSGVFDYGAGADVSIRRWLALRGEVRDFYSAHPVFNIPVSGRQHNVVAGGGFVLRLGSGQP